MKLFGNAISFFTKPFLFIKGKWNSIRIKRQLKGIGKFELIHIEQELDRVITALTSQTIEITSEKEIQGLQLEKKELLEKLTLIEIAEISNPKDESQPKQKYDLTYLKQEIEPVNSKIREIKQRRKVISKVNTKVEANGFEEIFQRVRKHLRREVKTLDYSTNTEEKKLQRQIDELLKSTGLVTAFHVREKKQKEEDRIRKAEFERRKKEQERKRKEQEAKKKKEQAEQKRKLDEQLKQLSDKEEREKLNREKLILNYRLEIAEQNTPWTRKISNANSFMEIRNAASDQGLHHTIDRGEKILDSYQELEQYSFSVSRMHYEKLQLAFNELNENTDVSRSQIEVIDWGCGQALATSVLVDYINKNKLKTIIKKITLIEPSLLALKRGVLHINTLLAKSMNPEIAIVNSLINESVRGNLLPSNSVRYHLHLLSNILDIPDIDTKELFVTISNTYKGTNIFVCVSPRKNTFQLQNFQDYFLMFPSSHIINEREFDFASKFGGRKITYCEKIFKAIIPQ